VKSSLMGQVIEYEAPRICVCGVFLCEGIMADVSFWPTIPVGGIKYTLHEEVSGYQDGDKDIMLF
jgi:hypothetical protein